MSLEPTRWWQHEALYTQPSFNISYYVQHSHNPTKFSCKIGDDSIFTHMLLCCLEQLYVMNYRVCVI